MIMKILKGILLVLMLISILPTGKAQQSMPDNKESGVLLTSILVGGHIPGRDMADRFGNNLAIGIGAEYITKSNWILGVEGDFHFGYFVDEDVISSLRGPEGFVVGNNSSFADIQLRQRGLYVGAYLGRLFSLVEGNSRSGLKTTIGLGLLQHKVRIQEDPQSFVPQLTDEYKKGYDQLSNGLAIQEFIGYQYLSLNRAINFYAGFEFIQGFTQNRRSFNFQTRSQDTTKRLDLLYGIKVGWSFAFYLQDNSEEIFY